MADWPSTLPKIFQREGFSASAANNMIETKMDSGAIMRRRLTTGAEAPLAGTMTMTTAQLATVRAFHSTGVGEVTPFNFPDPLDPLNATIVVVFKEPPGWVPHSSPGRWKVSLKFSVKA